LRFGFRCKGISARPVFAAAGEYTFLLDIGHLVADNAVAGKFR